MSQKFLPKQLSHLVSFPGIWLLHLGVQRKLLIKLWFGLNYSMQHPFGALTRNFRLIRLRKFRGQQPAGPAGDGETRVVSAKCLMSLNGHLLRPGGASLSQDSLWSSVHSFEKDKYMTPAHSLKTNRSSHSAQYHRHQTYSDALKNSFSPELFHI